MSFFRLKAYKIMWLFVMFDLPTNTPEERKTASGFRKNLLKNGFTMMQYSIYIRHCPSQEHAHKYENRIKTFLPPDGKVSIVKITDKQFSAILNFWGEKAKKAPPPPTQLEIF